MNSSLSSVLKRALATAVFAALAGCGGEDASKNLRAGEEALAAGDTEKAIRKFEASVAIAPANVDAWVMLAGAQLKFGDVANAGKSISCALDLAPNDADVVELAAQVAFYEKHYDQAEALYSKLAAGDQERALRSRALSGIGVVNMARIAEAGNLASVFRDRARTALLSAIRLDMKNSVARYHLGLVYRDLGYNEIARDNFSLFTGIERMRKRDGDERVAMVATTILPDLNERINEEKSHSKGADNRNSSAAADALKKARAAWDNGKYKTAKLRYTEAYAADVLNYDAALGLARAWEKTDSSRTGLDTALNYYYAACKLRPSAKDTLIKTAALATRLGKHSMAAEAYSRAVAASPYDPVAIEGLIKALKTIGRVKSAEIYRSYLDFVVATKR